MQRIQNAEKQAALGAVLIGNIGTGPSHQRRNVFATYGIAPTLMAGMGMGGGIIPFIVVKQDGKERQQ